MRNSRVESHLNSVDEYVNTLNQVYMARSTPSKSVSPKYTAELISDLLFELQSAVQNLYSTDPTMQKQIGQFLNYLETTQRELRQPLQQPSHKILQGIYTNQVYPIANTVYQFCNGEISGTELESMIQPAY